MIVVAGLVLAGCGGESAGKQDDRAPADPAMTRIEAGMCFAAAMPDGTGIAPDPATAVDCDQPHSWETITVQAIPARDLAGATDEEKLAHRAELAGADPLSDESREFAEQFAPQCRQEIRQMSGLAGISDADLNVTSKFGGDIMWFTLTPAAQWTSGAPEMICSVMFHQQVPEQGADESDPEAWKPLQLRSATKDPILTTYLTDGFPTELRVCYPNGCDEDHVTETLWRFDARAVFGKDFLAGTDPLNPPEEASRRINELCLAALQRVPGHETASGGIGWGFLADTMEAPVVHDRAYLSLGCQYSHEAALGSGWHAWSSDR